MTGRCGAGRRRSASWRRRRVGRRPWRSSACRRCRNSRRVAATAANKKVGFQPEPRETYKSVCMVELEQGQPASNRTWFYLQGMFAAAGRCS